MSPLNQCGHDFPAKTLSVRAFLEPKAEFGRNRIRIFQRGHAKAFPVVEPPGAKENLFGSGACTLFSHRVMYSLHDGGSQGMNLATAGVMQPKTSRASLIWNWLSCNLGDRMTIILAA